MYNNKSNIYTVPCQYSICFKYPDTDCKPNKWRKMENVMQNLTVLIILTSNSETSYVNYSLQLMKTSNDRQICPSFCEREFFENLDL